MRIALEPVRQPTGEVLRGAGRLSDARTQFWHDAEDAEANSDTDGLAVAALGLGGIWVHEHRSTLDQARVESLQRRALGALDPDSSLARRLEIRLAAETSYLLGDPAGALAELDRARAADDPVALADALSLAHHCLLGPHHTALRLLLADELIAVSPKTGRPIDGLMGLAWRTVDLVLAGDRRAGRSLAELRELLEVDRCDGLRYLADAIDIMLAVRAGRLDEATLLAAQCYEFGLEVGDIDALGWYGGQLVAIRWLQGRGEELLPLVRDLVHSTTIAEPAAGFVAAVAALAATSGDLPTAQAAIACLRADGLRAVASSSSWSATMLGVCEAAHALGDVEAAAEAYDLLAPFADLTVFCSLGVASYGSAHRPLALAAWTMGDLDLAVDHLESALVAEMAMGDGPWHTMAMAALADVLEQRNGADDRHRADELRQVAVAAARRLGMSKRADEWERRAGGATECRRDGRIWTVRLGERTAVVPHSVGMDYLTTLIAQPDVEISAVSLVSDHMMSCRGAPAEPVLDARAAASYRRRIEELRAELDDADVCADLERAARARIELDQFLDELRRASGLGGQARSFSDDAERARVSVHKAIKRALRMITEVDAVLGAQLASRVVTGMRCVFRTT